MRHRGFHGAQDECNDRNSEVLESHGKSGSGAAQRFAGVKLGDTAGASGVGMDLSLVARKAPRRGRTDPDEMVEDPLDPFLLFSAA